MDRLETTSKQQRLPGSACKDSYVLRQLEVFNWGPFGGMHRAEFDPAGTAVIGPTGSGKTTLIDGLMTLLVAQPRYNLASTGGHESDRTLISYVRGLLSGDGADGQVEVARSGPTVTGLCATYESDGSKLMLGGLLWTDGASNATGDFKKRWVFAEADDQTLANWLHVLHTEGVRDLSRLCRETSGLRLFESKKAYLAYVRKFFDVSEKAFTLLNRAAGLKQLNSIDEIFRDLVLDNHSAFERAKQVAGEFDNLAEIHAELETARKQVDSLRPVAKCAAQLEKLKNRTRVYRRLKQIVPVWFAIRGADLWTAKLEDLISAKEETDVRLADLRREEREAEIREKAKYEIYAAVGGNAIGDLESAIKAQEEIVASRRTYAENYRRIVRTLTLHDSIDQTTFAKNQEAVDRIGSEASEAHDTAEQAEMTARSRQNEFFQRVAEIDVAIQEVTARPGSNIAPRFQSFRSDLGTQLGLTDQQLPFVAELVEVKPEHSVWRGAIERAIGSERLRILVESRYMKDALGWINNRDNRLNVRLQEASLREDAQPRFADGFLAKLNFKSHPLAGSVKQLLVGRDRHCVSTPDELRRTEHAMTVEGTMSGRGGRYEKQDQKHLHSDWLTGFDNADQLRALKASREIEAEHLQESHAEVKVAMNRRGDAQERKIQIDTLAKLKFEQIDTSAAEEALDRSLSRRAALLDPASDAAQAKANYEAAEHERKDARKAAGEAERQLIQQVAECDHARRQRDGATGRIGSGLTQDESELATKKLPIKPGLSAEHLDDAERTTLRAVDGKLTQETTRVAERENDLVRLMELAKRVDTGALTDTGSELRDLPVYLERLRVLNIEALPEKLGRFLEYLNRSSDQGVTQLLTGIQEDVDEIRRRIDELNQTLVKVDFQLGRYLQLRPQPIRHETLRSLETAQRKLRTSTLEDDQGEKQFAALRSVIEILRNASERTQLQGSKALLDPRYRLQFFVVEVNRETGHESPPRTGSQSGSGGEKELMASHILTASLSYALCPPESARPRYATIILDEAFSKSSPSAAARIVEALRIFKLRPVFVTPNKEIMLLRKHTRRAICVRRIGTQSSLAPIQWEEIEISSSQAKIESGKQI